MLHAKLSQAGFLLQAGPRVPAPVYWEYSRVQSTRLLQVWNKKKTFKKKIINPN